MRTGKLTLVLLMAAAAALGCGDSKGSADGSAGRDGSATGGTGGTGGATGGTAGTSAAGGTAGTTATGGTAGTTATGGTAGTSAAGGTAGTTATGGAGGTAGTGGMGGTSATGGTGGAAANCEVPCLTSLLADCAPMGSCMSSQTLMPLGSNQCYSNGVKISTAIDVTGGAGKAVITYSKNNNVCYSVEAPVAGGTQNVTLTYKNAAGMTVATGTYDSSMMKATFMCTGGQTYEVSTANCANIPSGSTGMGGATGGSCPMGTCQ